MQAGVGFSAELVTEAAAREAARQAMERLGALQATLAFVFASYHYRDKYPALVATVQAVTGAPSLIGCSASGVLGPAGEFEDVPAVVVLAVREPGLESVTFAAPGHLAAPGAADELKASLPEGGGGCLLLLPDATQEAPAVTLKVVEDAAGGVPIVGGSAAGDPAARRCFKFVGTEALANAHAGALLRGPGAVFVGVTHACRPVGRPYTVTRADGNVIREIASRPAVEVLARTLMEGARDPGQASAGGVLLGLAVNPAKYPLGRGDFVIRTLVRIDAEEEALVVSDRVSAGQTVQFHVLDAESAHQDLLAMLTRLKVRLANARPRFGLYVDGAGRGQGLFGSLHHDVSLIREALGEFPLAGFFSRAELAPLDAVNYVHQYTGVLTVFA